MTARDVIAQALALGRPAAGARRGRADPHRHHRRPVGGDGVTLSQTLDEIKVLAATYSDSGAACEGDCLGSLCLACGHCMHSVANCDHECDPFGGCRNALQTDEVRIKRAAMAMADALKAALAVCDDSEANEGPYRGVILTVQIRDAIHRTLEGAAK